MSLSISFAGVRFPNPFTLASAPPTTTGEMIMRAFEAGWGGAIIKTAGPAHERIDNVSPRFAALNVGNRRMFGFENIELISDRPLEVWLEECRRIKDRFPEQVLIGSVMAAGTSEHDWKELVRLFQEAGCDMIECNLGCPHGMPERGMGSVCSQDPVVTGNIARWVSEVATVPVIIKLSPNVTDITVPAGEALAAGAHAISAINTVNVLMGVDLEDFSVRPSVQGRTTYGGYSGVAVKPIALKAVSDIARKYPGAAISATGGIATWRDAAEFLALGATNLQVCTEVMLRGFGIITELTQGLETYLERKGFSSLDDLVGRALPNLADHSALDFDYRPKAVIDEAKCIKCDKCVTACGDAAYQAITVPHPVGTPIKERGLPQVHLDRCTGCSLCSHVCPVDCIDIVEVAGAPREVTHYKQLTVPLSP
ncbi:NAD-dependent dihydropyrimidine dehydrogenase subunit PreA [bacterium]|nr:NAD-dependent dihydropyrimidine dehydrogenase subunit PreA [bacterium]